MGKQSFKPNPDTSTATTSSSAVANAGILLSAFDNSPGADHFALVTHGVDRHRLRIFNVRSSTVNNDYSSENKERFTSITWGQVADNGNLGQSNDGKPNKKRKTAGLLNIVALGTHTGAIDIYSLAYGAVVKRLADAHTMPVTDFVLNKAGTKGYSVAEDGYIVEWDIDSAKEITKWKASEKQVSKLKLSHDENTLAVAGHTISLWNLTDRKVFKKFTGHASPIKELAFTQQDDLLVSMAEDDRYVNVWDAQPTNDDTNNVSALTLENNVLHIAVSSTESSVLAVGEDGLLGIWQHASSANSVTTGPRSRGRKAIRSMTRQPDSNVKVVSSLSEETVIPILAATFVTDKNGHSVMIARGSSIKPSFEVVPFVSEETGAVLDHIVLSRRPVTNYLIDEEASLAANNLKTTQKTYNEATVKVVGSTDYTLLNPTMAESDMEQSIEQKLKEMGVEEKPTSAQKQPAPQRQAVPAAASLQQMLTQALHTSDKQLLEACLQHRNRPVIRNTVQRLQSAYVIPLLTQLIAKFQENPARGKDILEWIKAVLQLHTAYLMTVPDLVNKMSGFYQVLDARLSVFPKLLALRGRLDLIHSQIEHRKDSDSKNDEVNQALNVYVEQESDEEADEVDEGGADEDGMDPFMSDDEEEDEEEEEDFMDEDEEEDDDENFA